MLWRLGHNDKLKFCSPGGLVFQLFYNSPFCPREDLGCVLFKLLYLHLLLMFVVFHVDF